VTRPALVIVVAGTGTEVGKTWVGARLLERLRRDGVGVAARKPAQSFGPDDQAAGEPTDADVLARAAGVDPHEVCPPDRWYPVAMAPPMAADELGRPPIALGDLVDEIRWPDVVAVGVVETAGGVRSPMAHDGDGADLIERLRPDVVIVVADAGLGVIHNVRTTVGAVPAGETVVYLNRYDPGDRLHVLNRQWLERRDGMAVETDVDGLAARLRQRIAAG
jgi:dethiobiotin synthetase